MKNYYLHRLNSDILPFELWDGVFTLGSGKMDDLTMKDLKESQIRFVYVDGFISIQASLLPIWLDGHLMDQFPFEVGPSQVLSLSEEVHVVFNLSATECDVPIPTLRGAPVADKTKKKIFVLKDFRVVLTGVVLALMCVSLLLMIGGFLSKNHTVLEPNQSSVVTPTPLSEAEVNQYIQRIIGKHLLSVRKEGLRYHIRTLAVDSDLERRWVNDLDKLMQLLPQETEIDLDTVPMEKLMFHVKHDLQVIDGIKNIDIHRKDRDLVVRAIVPSVTAAVTAFEKVKAKYPFFVFTHDFHEVRINFQILALTVSRHNASVTVSYNNQTITIPEGGQVPDLGILRLIKHNGISVATAYGEVFVPWNRI